MKNNKDEQILSLLRANMPKDEAFTLLASHYKQALYFHIRRIVITHEDAEDALQETLVRAYRHLHKFREQSNIYTWLYRIATNEAMRLLEKRERQKKYNLDDYYLSQMDKGWAHDADKINIMVQKAIACLPAKQKVVFSLRYYNELSYKEIEQITDIKENALKVSYHLAEKKIKEFLALQL